MIKKLLFIFKLLFSIASTCPTPYDTLRSNFKENMYKKQSGLMNHKTYMKFLEEHLIEGEKSLIIPRTALELKKRDSSDLEAYFDLLVKINTTLFFHYIKPSNRTEQSLKKRQEELLDVIQDIKTKWRLNNLDPEIELHNTIDFFSKANRDFYNKLGIGARLKISVASAASKLLPTRK